MSNIQTLDTAAISRLILSGDISKLNDAERVQYVHALCEATNLDIKFQPFQLLNLQGRQIVYATKAATEQLRKLHGISLEIVNTNVINDVFVVTARASMANGRTDTSTGAVNIANLKGDALANALMKAETKAKRRVTLSICGLGMLDESEIETIPAAQVIVADEASGEVLKTKEQLLAELVRVVNMAEWLSDEKHAEIIAWCEKATSGKVAFNANKVAQKIIEFRQKNIEEVQ